MGRRSDVKRHRMIWLALGCFVVLCLAGADLLWNSPFLPSLVSRAQAQPPGPGEVYPPEPLTDVEGFSFVDTVGNTYPVESVEQLEARVRERAGLGPGQDIVLFKQRIGDKTGLLVFGASKEFASALVERRLDPAEVTIPELVVPPPKVVEAARTRVLEITGKGRGISLSELQDLGSAFNKATAAEPDPELTDAVTKLLQELAQSQ